MAAAAPSLRLQLIRYRLSKTYWYWLSLGTPSTMYGGLYCPMSPHLWFPTAMSSPGAPWHLCVSLPPGACLCIAWFIPSTTNFSTSRPLIVAIALVTFDFGLRSISGNHQFIQHLWIRNHDYIHYCTVVDPYSACCYNLPHTSAEISRINIALRRV